MPLKDRSMTGILTTKRIVRVLLTAAAIVAIPLSGLPQTDTVPPSNKRYPWDIRPNKCFVSGDVLDIPGCRPPPDWTDYQSTIDRVGSLLANEDFDLIERAEKEVGLSAEKFSTGEYLFDAWYVALQNIFEHTPERGVQLAQEWAKAKGTEGYSKFAEALARYGQAWEAREGGYVDRRNVSPEAWKIYYRKLNEANEILDSASPAIKRMGPWYAFKLRVAYEEQQFASTRDLLPIASDAWPDYPTIYWVPMALRLRDGALAETDGIARYAVEKSRTQLGVGMYALTYQRVLSNTLYRFQDTKANWNLMKDGFRDLESRNWGRPYMWAGFARLACQVRDRPETRRLYVLFDRLNGPVTNDADPCREFAMSHH